MASTCYAMVRGSVARFTLLDSRGAPLEGPASTLTTRGITTIQIDEMTDSQSTQLLRDDADRPRVLLHGYDETIGYSADITLCGVDPDIVTMLTAQAGVQDYAGDTVGNVVQTRTVAPNFALEVFTRLSGATRGYAFGYTLFPRLRGGRMGGFQFSNGAVTFKISGARSLDMSRWMSGPYILSGSLAAAGWDSYPWDVYPWDAEPSGLDPACRESDNLGAEEGTARRLPLPVSSRGHWLTFLVDAAPSPSCGAQALVDIVDNGDADSPGTGDVIDGQFVVTSADTLEGGRAA